MNNKLMIIISLGVIIFFLTNFYKEYASAKAKETKQADLMKMAEDNAYLNQMNRKEYKNWEYIANKILDPGNLFGFR